MSCMSVSHDLCVKYVNNLDTEFDYKIEILNMLDFPRNIQGYSTGIYLTRLPVNVYKVQRSQRSRINLSILTRLVSCCCCVLPLLS